MPPKKYQIKLSDEEIIYLQDFLKSGRSNQQIKRARILLLANVNNGILDKAISKKLGINRTTVYRVCRRFSEEGLDGAIFDRYRPDPAKIFDSEDEQKIIDLVKGSPPSGHSRWSIRLLETQINEWGLPENLPSRETIRLILKKHDLKPWEKETRIIHEGKNYQFC